MGHGHVIKNPDGSVARCGGPGICAECSQELVAHLKELPITNKLPIEKQLEFSKLETKALYARIIKLEKELKLFHELHHRLESQNAALRKGLEWIASSYKWDGRESPKVGSECQLHARAVLAAFPESQSQYRELAPPSPAEDNVTLGYLNKDVVTPNAEEKSNEKEISGSTETPSDDGK